MICPNCYFRNFDIVYVKDKDASIIKSKGIAFSCQKCKYVWIGENLLNDKYEAQNDKRTRLIDKMLEEDEGSM